MCCKNTTLLLKSDYNVILTSNRANSHLNIVQEFSVVEYSLTLTFYFENQLK